MFLSTRKYEKVLFIVSEIADIVFNFGVFVSSCLKVLHQILDDENSESHPRLESKSVMPPLRNRRRSGDSVNSQSYGNNKRMSNVSSEGGDKVSRSIIEQVEEAVIESITVMQFPTEKLPFFQ